MMNAVLLTSEPLTKSILGNFLETVSDVTLLGTYDTLSSLMSSVHSGDIDVLFADADFVVRSSALSVINPYGDTKPVVVVLAKDAGDALKCYEITGVVDYIVKPSTVERLYISINKVRLNLSMINAYREATSSRMPSKDYIFIKVNKKMVRLSLDDIYYIESVKDYIKIVTEKKSFLVYNTLTNFTASLPSSRFARIHRSYTIAIDKIEAIDGNTIEILNTRLPFSKKFIKETFMTSLR